MSILSEVTAGKKYVVNGIELEIKSPHVDKDIEVLLEGKQELKGEEQISMMKRLVKNMLKDSIPDATEQELDDCVRLNNLLKFIDIFYEVSGMNDEENLSKAEKIKNAIEQRREAAKSKTG